MSYTKQNFSDGQTLKAEHLIKMEDGILESRPLILILSQKDGYVNSNILKDYETGEFITKDFFFSQILLRPILLKDRNHYSAYAYSQNDGVHFLCNAGTNYAVFEEDLGAAEPI